MSTRKTPPVYEVNYVSLVISANVVEGLYPYLIDEAVRRGESIDTIASSILNENLARKRTQSRSYVSKKAKLLTKTASPLNRNKQ